MKLFLDTPNPSGYRDRIAGLICAKGKWVEIAKGCVLRDPCTRRSTPHIAQELRTEGFP